MLHWDVTDFLRCSGFTLLLFARLEWDAPGLPIDRLPLHKNLGRTSDRIPLFSLLLWE